MPTPKRGLDVEKLARRACQADVVAASGLPAFHGTAFEPLCQCRGLVFFARIIGQACARIAETPPMYRTQMSGEVVAMQPISGEAKAWEQGKKMAADAIRRALRTSPTKEKAHG